MRAKDGGLRVSVSTLDRVIFESPRDGALMLALERKATVLDDIDRVYVRAQPFGGAVQLRKPDALRALIGEYQFDSERSRSVQDFRILIRDSDWAAVRQFCLQHLRGANDTVLEYGPVRELVEEFAEGLQINLQPQQYVYKSAGFAVEDEPSPTDNIYSRGVPTVRIYHIFEVRIVDKSLCEVMMAASQRTSDGDLANQAIRDAQNGGRGWANTLLTMPYGSVQDSYLGIPLEKRYKHGFVDGHQLDSSVLAILDGVKAPPLQRLGEDGSELA